MLMYNANWNNQKSNNMLCVSSICITDASQIHFALLNMNAQIPNKKNINEAVLFSGWHHLDDSLGEEGGSRIGTISGPKTGGQILGYPLYFMRWENVHTLGCPAARLCLHHRP